MNAYGNYPDLTRVKRVLVIKLRHHGDVLLTSPVFSLLKQRMPDAQIYAFIYKETLPMLDGHPAITGFHLYDINWKKLSFWKKAARELGLVRDIRNNRYDLVINLTEGDRGAFASKLSKAVYRVGVDPQGQGFSFKKNIYTHIIRHCRNPRHMVEQNLDAVRRIGIFPSEDERELVLQVPEASRSKISGILHTAGISDQRYILIHPTSRWMFKCWPVRGWIRLIQQLSQAGYPIVLSSAPDPKELDMIEQILSGCPDARVLNLGGKLSLKDLAALIHSSGCLVSIDSVPMHMASALKVPSIAIFGPSSETAWGPWKNPKSRVIAEPMTCRPCNLDGCGGGKVCDCLEKIPVERVFQEIITLFPPSSSRG